MPTFPNSLPAGLWASTFPFHPAVTHPPKIVISLAGSPGRREPSPSHCLEGRKELLTTLWRFCQAHTHSFLFPSGLGSCVLACTGQEGPGLPSVHPHTQAEEGSKHGNLYKAKESKERVRILGDMMCMRAKSRELVWLLFRKEFEGRFDGEPVCKGSHVSLLLRLL